MAKNDEEQNKKKEGTNIGTMAVIGAVAGVLGALATTALLDPKGRQKIDDSLDDITKMASKTIKGLKDISEQYDELRSESQKRIKQIQSDTRKYLDN
jgi:hypothetical protein